MLSTSVVIPVYKKLELFSASLGTNIPHLLNTSKIIIVNDDPDISLDDKSNLPQDKKILFIQNPKNLGFAKSVNIGVASTNSDLVMLLNTDVFLKDDSWKRLVTYFENDPTIFAISFAQQDNSGHISGRNRVFFKDGLFQHSTLAFEKADGTDSGRKDYLLSTAWAEGGAAIFRKSMWGQLGGFDENFSPFYWEDVDLSYRAKQMGWGVLFDPNTIVLHKHESTIGALFDKDFVKNIAFKHQLYFTKKHAGLIQKIGFAVFLFKSYISRLIRS